MQATGDLVAAAAELAAGVQLGEHELDGADALGRVHVGGDAAPVVLDADRAVLHERDVDGVGVPGEGLVDRVVDDLPHEVVQAALAGGADVHAGALAHRLEALEDGDRAGVVGRAVAARGPGPPTSAAGSTAALRGSGRGSGRAAGPPRVSFVGRAPPERPAGHMARAQGRRTPWARFLALSPTGQRRTATCPGEARGGTFPANEGPSRPPSRDPPLPRRRGPPRGCRGGPGVSPRDLPSGGQSALQEGADVGGQVISGSSTSSGGRSHARRSRTRRAPAHRPAASAASAGSPSSASSELPGARRRRGGARQGRRCARRCGRRTRRCGGR